MNVALDARERLIHCHHEKLVVVDDELAFVGGLDLTYRAGDRYDLRSHPDRGSLGWHDLAFRIRGPLVTDVARHFAARWGAVTGERLPSPSTPEDAGEVEAQLVRTLPEHLYPFAPRGDFRILESYLRAVQSAQQLVYIENQFLWAPEIVTALARKLRRPPRDDFRVVLILPSRANQGRDDTYGQLQVLADADGGGGRFTASTISAVDAGKTERVYVHAKTRSSTTAGSRSAPRNLSSRCLYNDTEVNVVTHDRQLARQTRLRLWAEHLDHIPAELNGRPRQTLGWMTPAEKMQELLLR